MIWWNLVQMLKACLEGWWAWSGVMKIRIKSLGSNVKDIFMVLCCFDLNKKRKIRYGKEKRVKFHGMWKTYCNGSKYIFEWNLFPNSNLIHQWYIAEQYIIVQCFRSSERRQRRVSRQDEQIRLVSKLKTLGSNIHAAKDRLADKWNWKMK